jgi:hypothetical protein
MPKSGAVTAVAGASGERVDVGGQPVTGQFRCRRAGVGEHGQELLSRAGGQPLGVGEHRRDGALRAVAPGGVGCTARQLVRSDPSHLREMDGGFEPEFLATPWRPQPLVSTAIQLTTVAMTYLRLRPQSEQWFFDQKLPAVLGYAYRIR